MMRVILSSIPAIAISLLFAGPLHAAGQCGNYGDQGVLDAQRAEALKCGFSGPRYALEKKIHVRWCVGVINEDKDAEQGRRSHQLGKCDVCRGYANAANAAQRDNLAFRCGFGGPQWSLQDGGPNDGHFQWCMRSSETEYAGAHVIHLNLSDFKQARMDHHTNARSAAIKDCKTKIDQHFSETERKFCRDYANTAFADANINVAKKCGATPVSRWSQNEREHFEACIPIAGTESGKAFLTEEEKIRRYGVDACVEKGWKLGEGGKPIRVFGRPPKPAVAGTKPMEGRPSGGSDRSKGSASTNTPAGKSGGGSNPMDMLGGGPSGGFDNVRDGGTPGTKSKPTTGGAAIITPAATTAPKKQFGTNKSSSQDFGIFHPAPPKASPVR